MHPLAFDKDGHPFEFEAETVDLLVRRFRKPGERGTCEALFDEDGDPLAVPKTSTVPEFREAVAYIAGLYRLDQRREDGTVIPGVPAAYVAVDPSRNASGPGGADPLLVIRDMARDSAEVTKTLATSAAGMMNAATENMRVAVGGGLGNRRLLGMLSNAAAALEGASDDGDEDEDDDDDDEDGGDPDPDGPAAPPPASDPLAMLAALAPLLKPALPKIGELIGARLSDWLNTLMGARPAAGASSTTATPSGTASEPTTSGATASGPAAGPGAGAGARATSAAPATAAPDAPPPAGPSTTATSSTAAASAETATAPQAPVASEQTTALATNPTSAPEVRNAAPTGAQIGHLFAIRTLLTPREVAIADEVIARMDGPTRAGWIAELCALPIDQAAERVRSHIPSLRPAKASRATDDAGKE